MCIKHLIDKKYDENRLYYKAITKELTPLFKNKIRYPIGHWINHRIYGVYDYSTLYHVDFTHPAGFFLSPTIPDLHLFIDGEFFSYEQRYFLIATCQVRQIVAVGREYTGGIVVIVKFMKILSVDNYYNFMFNYFHRKREV